MKYVLWTLGGLAVVVVLAVLGLYLYGMRGNAGRLHAEQTIAAAPAELWPWLRDGEKLKSWVGWLVEVRIADPGGDGFGTRQIWVMEDRNNNNQLMDIATEITRHEADRVLEAKVSAAEGFTGDVRYELEPMDTSKTKLTYRAHYKFDHWLAKLLEPIISRSAQQKLEEDLQRLKQQVEAS